MAINCAECNKEMTGEDKVYYLSGWDNEYCSKFCLIESVKQNYEIEKAKYLE